MSSLSFRRAVVALALGWILVSPLSSAELGGRAGHRSSPTVTQEVRGVFGQLWEMLVSLLGKAGCSADPDGLLGGSPDAGCSVDPSATLADNGCSADPDGRCKAPH